MPRPKPPHEIVQFNIRIPAELDKRLRAAAAAMPIHTIPQKLAIRGIELAIIEAKKMANTAKKL